MGPALTAAPAAASATSGTVERFVESLLAQLTLEEKVGQMVQADIASITPGALEQFKLGSILAGGNAAPQGNPRVSPQAWLDLTDEFHRAALGGAGGNHQSIPLLIGIDAVHGHAKVRGATVFPHNIGLGAAHDPDLIRRVGAATAAEVAATGFDWTFAPTVAVARDVRWGRSYESYSESPGLIARYAPAMVIGLQGELGTPTFMSPGHTLSSVKHFLGDGGTLNGRDQGDTVVPEALLAGVHAAGYAPAIRAGAMIVMASYSSWNGVKMHANHHLITDVLKGRMGFDGFVVGDWNAQEQIPGCTKSDCAAAVLAGVDMLMAPDSWKEIYEHTLAEVRAGEIPQARIDDAVRRILRVKARAGLFGRTPPPPPGTAGHFEVLGSTAHRALAREAVRKSLVLLKNAHATLPLNPHAHILVAGGGADDIGTQSGGWTVDWQGDHNTNADFPGATSIYAGIAAAVAGAGGTATLSREGRFTIKPDAAVVVFGEGPYAEFQGDRETLQFSPGDKRDLELLRRLRRLGIPVVSVFLSGRPLWVNPEINASDAFVAAWLPGSEGEGIADVLFMRPDGTRGFDFTGRLSFSWPDTAMPVTYAPASYEPATHEPGGVTGAAFPEGFGLDYEHPAEARRMSEEPRIPTRFQAPPGSLFHAGHPTAPWSLFVADGGAEVHVTTPRQASPHGRLRVALSADGAEASWNGAGEASLRITGRAADLRVEASGPEAIEVRYRLGRRPDAPVSLGMRCTDAPCGTAGGAMLDLTGAFRTAAVGDWQTLIVPVSCLAAAGADLARVEVPFTLETAGRFVVTLAAVRLAPERRGAHAACPPRAAVAAVAAVAPAVVVAPVDAAPSVDAVVPVDEPSMDAARMPR